MVDRAHAAWRDGHIAGVLLMDIKAAFPSVAKGRLVNLMKAGKWMETSDERGRAVSWKPWWS